MKRVKVKEHLSFYKSRISQLEHPKGAKDEINLVSNGQTLVFKLLVFPNFLNQPNIFIFFDSH